MYAPSIAFSKYTEPLLLEIRDTRKWTIGAGVLTHTACGIDRSNGLLNN